MAAIWIILFGTAGAAIARVDRSEGVRGFVIGALLGPVGLIWLSISMKRKTGATAFNAVLPADWAEVPTDASPAPGSSSFEL